EEVGRHLLEHDTPHAETDGFQDLRLRGGRREQYGLGRQLMALHFAKNGQAVLTGQPQVEDENVRLVALHRGQAVLAGPATSDDAEAGALEEPRTAAKNGRVRWRNGDRDG